MWSKLTPGPAVVSHSQRNELCLKVIPKDYIWSNGLKTRQVHAICVEQKWVPIAYTLNVYLIKYRFKHDKCVQLEQILLRTF